MSSFLQKLYWLASTQFGIDPRLMFESLVSLPRYARDYLRFRAGYTGRLEMRPCLHDWRAEGAAIKNEYFVQDLYVARKIYAARPEKHVDIGSRVDGFVAHVASFRELEVFDIRPITANIPGITFRQADLMHLTVDLSNYCDSLSCLHALEHFGLGRYGDPIDPNGHEAGLQNMIRILRPGGVLYLSVPVGTERVEFNAHRVFEPSTIIDLGAANKCSLRGFALIEPGGNLIEPPAASELLPSIGQIRYGLGLFTFVKE